MKNIILVTGTHRSGTTWVRRTMSASKKVRYIHEPMNPEITRIVDLPLQNFYTDYQASALKLKDDIDAALDVIFKMDSFEYAERRSKIKNNRGFRRLAVFSRDYVKDKIFCESVLIKDPLALLSAEHIQKRYNAKVVVLIRNPFSFVYSNIKAGWDFDFANIKNQDGVISQRFPSYQSEIERVIYDYDSTSFVERSVLTWNILHEIIKDYRTRFPDWHFVRYEDIAFEPEKHFRKMFSFLGLTYNRNISEYISKMTSSNNPADAGTTGLQARDSRSIVSAWKNQLSEEDKCYIEKKLLSYLSSFTRKV
ncbi:MAG: sulfotransferase [Pseudomonadota bacterium]|nr:sulfotransferase [Pseudomonadota bacterium]